MGVYRRWVFPRLCDLAMKQKALRELRMELLGQATAPVLEIGAGTGLNFDCYPQHIRRIQAVDPNSGMLPIAQRRAQLANLQVEQRREAAESLSFDDSSFGSVVCTWTLCSVADPLAVLRQAFRVLRPGGQFLFIEHGLSDEPAVRRWQRRLNWLQQRLADGCRLDVDLEELLAGSPFARVEMRKFYLARMPKSHGFLRLGVARKADET